MTEQDKITKQLVNYVVSFMTIVLIGSFVVSFKIIDLAYLMFFYSFLIVYKVCK